MARRVAGPKTIAAGLLPVVGRLRVVALRRRVEGATTETTVIGPGPAQVVPRVRVLVPPQGGVLQPGREVRRPVAVVTTVIGRVPVLVVRRVPVGGLRPVGAVRRPVGGLRPGVVATRAIGRGPAGGETIVPARQVAATRAMARARSAADRETIGRETTAPVATAIGRAAHAPRVHRIVARGRATAPSGTARPKPPAPGARWPVGAPGR